MRRILKRRLTAMALGTTLTVTSVFTGGIADPFTGTVKAADGQEEVMKFDFGIDASMVAEGWTGVTVNAKGAQGATESLYTESKGYGFDKELEGGKEDVGANDAYRNIPSTVYSDFAIAKENEFKVDIANGVYDIDLIIGSVNSNSTSIIIEDELLNDLDPGKEAVGLWSTSVTVKDGQINFVFPSDQDGVINGIIISKEDGASATVESIQVGETVNEAVKDTTMAPTETVLELSNEELLSINEYNFDFNITGTDTAEGWTGITVNKKGGSTETDYLYSPEKGYGFLDNGSNIEGRSEKVGNNTNYNFSEELYTDFALVSGREFVVDIDNGVYALQFIVGSTNSNTTKVTVENLEEKSINAGKETFGVLTITDVEVTDGQLNMKFGGDGRLNGIVITSVSAPTDLVEEVNYSDLSVSLNWKGASGLVSYNVYRTNNDTKVTTKIGNVVETSYVDDTAELFGKYTYFVKGVSAKGIESAATNEVSVELKNPSVAVPESPINVKVTNVTDDSTTISWDPVEGALLYQVYWSDRNRTDLEGTDGFALIDETKDTTYTYKKSTHVDRYFKVVAVNAGGSSKPSDVVVANAVAELNAQAEYLDRGLVAMMTEDGVYVGFRLRADEYANNTSFEIYRDGKLVTTIASTENTNYLDTEGTLDSVYTVKAITNGVRYKACNPVHVLADQYLDVKMDIPDPIYDSKLTETYEYSINDTSLGDADGDGEYELYVKWDPSNSKDNSKSGFTGPTIIDCYKLDGTRLFRINLGINIRSGAHYTQFQVFDFDGDGKAELICKTADGTVDGKGNVIGDTSADYRNDSGYVLDGPEYLTLFDGLTGEELDTIDYNPARGNVGDWGDKYGNRVDRFLAGVAYLDGEHPSAIFARGYYTRAVVCAYDVVDKKLTERWVIDSNDEANKSLYGQGAHSLTVSDVDNDGCQEVVYGSATIDNDGTLMYSLSDAGSGYGGHGDAQRVGDFNLKNPGMEIFMVHENKPSNAGIEMHNGIDGNYLFAFPTTVDTGRGATGDIDPRYEGVESWAIKTARWDTSDGIIVSQDGEVISNIIPAANFTIYWDGDLGKEIVDHTFLDNGTDYYPVSVNITKWNWETQEEDVLLESAEVYSNNGTKGNPSFQADIFGDWREEVAWRLTDNSAIRIYSTVDMSDYRLYTFMHDTQYRAQVACEGTAYNQPPTQSFYVGFDEDLIEVPVPNLNMVNAAGKDEPETTPPTEPEVPSTEETAEETTEATTETNPGESSTDESTTVESTQDVVESSEEESMQESEEPSSSVDSSENTNTPPTGDHAPIQLIFTIMVLALISVSSMMLMRRKTKN